MICTWQGQSICLHKPSKIAECRSQDDASIRRCVGSYGVDGTLTDMVNLSRGRRMPRDAGVALSLSLEWRSQCAAVDR